MNYYSFKPYYKWITFNMVNWYFESWKIGKVLNLIINGLPSILLTEKNMHKKKTLVLNLIINGLPSI